MVNFTPHAIVVRFPNGEERTYPPSGEVARVRTTDYPHVEVEGVPTVIRKFGSVEVPPFPTGETAIVSLVALEAAGRDNHPRRLDLVAPDTGPTAVRDGEGKILAVRRFIVA